MSPRCDREGEDGASLSKDFPLRHDATRSATTPRRSFAESIKEVFKSLRDSIILVSLVVLLFLQSWRAAVIPLAAVPVAIIGTFAAMAAVGFSVNLLTLFGLILAVGIVVDDAIVVVEAVQQQLELGFTCRGKPPSGRWSRLPGPIIAVGVVLSFVFFPCVFVPGIVGMFFKQFALTIASSTIISTFNSLTLSPALCALLLKPKTAESARRPRMPRLAVRCLDGICYGHAVPAAVRSHAVRPWLPASWQHEIGPLEPWFYVRRLPLRWSGAAWSELAAGRHP